MKYQVVYQLPTTKKIQKATFFKVEDAAFWEKHVTMNLNANNVEIMVNG